MSPDLKPSCKVYDIVFFSNLRKFELFQHSSLTFPSINFHGSTSIDSLADACVEADVKKRRDIICEWANSPNKFQVLPAPTLHLYVLYVPRNKHELFPKTSLKD
jgi:hypothetical protein